MQYNIKYNKTILFEIYGFRRGVVEAFALLGCYYQHTQCRWQCCEVGILGRVGVSKKCTDSDFNLKSYLDTPASQP
jgi:hypothetical protein